MKRLLFAFVLLTIVLYGATPASASSISTGQMTTIPGDWVSVQILEDTNWGGLHSMTGLDLYLVSGDSFLGNGFVNLSNGWTATSNGVHASASGSASGPFTFNIQFVDGVMQTSMYYVAHGLGAAPTAQEAALFGSNFLGYGSLMLNANGGFSFTQLTLSQDGFTPSTVPEPASLVLFGSGLVGLVAIARRRRKA